MSIFKKILQSDRTGAEQDEVTEQQPNNPFTELLFLEEHRDIVRILLKIDSERCATAADDNLAIIWDIVFGYKLVTLSGHCRPITCMVLLQQPSQTPKTIATGSSDKQIRIWDIGTGDCYMVITEHLSSTKCLLLLSVDGRFCSAGTNVCVWSMDYRLMAQRTQTKEENDVSNVIELYSGHLVTASEKNLVVYEIEETETLTVVKQLQSHGESVTCLSNLNEQRFISGSLDGMIIVWDTGTLSSLLKLNSIDHPEGPEKTFPHSVQHLQPFAERYICAAIGNGIVLFDVEDQGREVFSKKSAHQSKINQMCFVCDGLYLASCAVDGSIRIWSCCKDSFRSEFSDIYNTDQGFMNTRLSEEHKLALIGECLAHSGAVQGLLDCDGESLLSCAVDGLVIVWKNENMQVMKRNQALQKATSCVGIV